MDKLTDWTKRIASLDSSVRPIATRPIDITQPDWLGKLRDGPRAVDEAGVRAETESLLSEVIKFCLNCEDHERESLRALFATHRSFSWGAALPYEPITDDRFRSHLILFALKEGGRDSRDSVLQLRSLCGTASSNGLVIGPTLKEVALLFSDKGIYETHSLFLWMAKWWRWTPNELLARVLKRWRGLMGSLDS